MKQELFSDCQDLTIITPSNWLANEVKNISKAIQDNYNSEWYRFRKV